MDTDKARTNNLSFAINYPVVAFGDGHHIILTVAENMREGSVWSHSRYVVCGMWDLHQTSASLQRLWEAGYGELDGRNASL